MRLFFLIAALTLTLSASAQQEWREEIKADRYLSATNHHPYIVPEFKDTKAPKGYKAFYVSHYGRHGSRYHVSSKKFEDIVPLLDTLHTLGLLTEAGEGIRADLNWMADAQYKLDGILTQKGSREHQGIGRRLYERCPEIFTQKDRPVAYSISSPVQRCIQSMANFTLAIKGKAPQIDFQLHTGERYFAIVAFRYRNQDLNIITNHMIDSLVNVRFSDTTALRFFKDPDKFFKKEGSLKKTVYTMMSTACIAQCFDGEVPDPFRFFTDDEIYSFYTVSNGNTAAHYSHTQETGTLKERNIGVPLLRDFIEKADAAIEGNDRCADLRFGHDGGLGPLLALLRVEGYDKVLPMGECYKEWPGWRYIPMGSNFQMIFYRNKTGNVLVKLLRNEEETTIPAVPTFDGPYYQWSELRRYLVGLLD